MATPNTLADADRRTVRDRDDSLIRVAGGGTRALSRSSEDGHAVASRVWYRSLRRAPVGWTCEFAFRAVIRALVKYKRGLRTLWWIDRLYPQSTRAFPARV